MCLKAWRRKHFAAYALFMSDVGFLLHLSLCHLPCCPIFSARSQSCCLHCQWRSAARRVGVWLPVQRDERRCQSEPQWPQLCPRSPVVCAGECAQGQQVPHQQQGPRRGSEEADGLAEAEPAPMPLRPGGCHLWGLCPAQRVEGSPPAGAYAREGLPGCIPSSRSCFSYHFASWLCVPDTELILREFVMPGTSLLHCCPKLALFRIQVS